MLWTLHLSFSPDFCRFLRCTQEGKGGVKYRQHCSFCPAAPGFLQMSKERSHLHMFLVIKIFVWILNILQNPSCAQKLEWKGKGGEGRWEMGEGKGRGQRQRPTWRADLRTANFHGRQLGANVLCFSALGHGKVIQFHRTCYRQTRNVLCME